MECLRCLFSHRQPDGHRYQQDTPVFYLCLHPDDGLPDYYLYGPRLLEKYAQVYLGGEKESLVLFVGIGE